MRKKLNFQRWFVPLVLFWMVFCIFVYFFTIAKAQDTTCNLSSACLHVEGISWQIIPNLSHQYYTDAFLESIGIGPSKSHVPGPVLLIVIGLLFLYAANLFYDRFIEKKKELSLSLTPFSIFLIATVIFFLIYNRWTAFFGLDAPVRYSTIFAKYPIFVGELLSIIFLTISVGRKLVSLILPEKEHSSKLRELLLALGFGLIAIILVLYALGIFKVLLLQYVLIVLGAMLLFSIKSLNYWLKSFFTQKISFKSNYFDASVFLALLLLLALAQNILDLIRPLPIGFDDLNVYMNNPHIMAVKGALISGAMSYYWELFTSLGFILYKTVTSAMLISFISGMGSLLALLYLISNYCKKRGFDLKASRFYSLLIGALFFTLPAVVFHLAKDIKVDLAGLFFTLLSLVVFWEWREKYLEKNEYEAKPYLVVAAFLAGFATAIKYTNLIFVFVLFIYLVIVLLKKHKITTLKRHLVIPVLFIVFSILPILPINIRNIVQTKSFAVADIRFGARPSQEIKIDPPFSTADGVIENLNEYMVKKASGEHEEADRYIGYDKGVKKYLLLPLRITQNVFTSSLYVDISFLFLFFIPIAIYALIKLRKDPKAVLFGEMALIGAVYWIAWAFTASGIIWYGFSGFIFLFIAIVEAFNYIKNRKNGFLYTTTCLLVLFWFVCAIFLRMANLPKYNIGIDPGGIRYARGDSSPEDNLMQKFGYASVIEKINQDIAENPTNPPKVYRVGTFYKYIIARNDETVIDDQMLDVFAYCYQDHDDAKLIERFKNSGIRYIILDRGMRNVDKTPEQSYTKKYDQFEKLIRNNASKHFGIMSDSSDQKFFILRIY